MRIEVMGADIVQARVSTAPSVLFLFTVINPTVSTARRADPGGVFLCVERYSTGPALCWQASPAGGGRCYLIWLLSHWRVLSGTSRPPFRRR